MITTIDSGGSGDASKGFCSDRGDGSVPGAGAIFSWRRLADGKVWIAAAAVSLLSPFRCT